MYGRHEKPPDYLMNQEFLCRITDTDIVMYTESVYFVFSAVSPICPDTGIAPSTTANPR